MPEFPRRISRPPVEYRGPGGGVVWTDGRAWESLPAVGAVLVNAGLPYVVTAVVGFGDERAPCVFVTPNPRPYPRSIRLGTDAE